MPSKFDKDGMRIKTCEVCQRNTQYLAACRSGCPSQHRLCPWCISWLNMLLERLDATYKGEGVFVMCPPKVPDSERVVHALGGHRDVSERVIERLASLGFPMEAAETISRASREPR